MLKEGEALAEKAGEALMQAKDFLISLFQKITYLAIIPIYMFYFLGTRRDLLDDVEAAARRAIERGMSAEQAGEEYRLPSGMEDWVLFNPGYFGRAIGAWMGVL